MPLMQNKNVAIGVGGSSNTELSTSLSPTVSEGWSVDRNNVIELHLPYHGRTIDISNKIEDGGVNPDTWTAKHPRDIVAKDEFYWDIKKVHSYGSTYTGLPPIYPDGNFRHEPQDFEVHIVKKKFCLTPFQRFRLKLWKTIVKVELQAIGWITMLRNEDDTLEVNMDLIPKE